jgi:hypothetical protein
MPASRTDNDKELLKRILEEIRSLKTIICEIRLEIAKLNRIENQLKKGENLAEKRDGWFWNY